MSQISIRVAHSTEYEQLAARYTGWGYRAGILPVDIVYVAESGNHVVGLVRQTSEGVTTMLRGMHVDPTHQRLGVGTRLLEAFVAGLSGVECLCIPFIHLTTFYGRAGFTVVNEAAAPAFLGERVERYQREGHDVLIMRRAQHGQDRDHTG
jgi:GNAT superfamily N-acetyltransferase